MMRKLEPRSVSLKPTIIGHVITVIKFSLWPVRKQGWEKSIFHCDILYFFEWVSNMALSLLFFFFFFRRNIILHIRFFLSTLLYLTLGNLK